MLEVIRMLDRLRLSKLVLVLLTSFTLLGVAACGGGGGADCQ